MDSVWFDCVVTSTKAHCASRWEHNSMETVVSEDRDNCCSNQSINTVCVGGGGQGALFLHTNTSIPKPLQHSNE